MLLPSCHSRRLSFQFLASQLVQKAPDTPGRAFGFGPQNLMETPPDVLVDSAAEWTTALSPAKIDL
jgi:hypothetical protein